MLQQVKFFVFINHFFGHAKAIQRLATQAEHGLGIHIACFSDGPLAESPSVIRWYCSFAAQSGLLFLSTAARRSGAPAVAQLFIMQVCFLCAFIR
jgi:hypothetical protein